MIDIHCHLLPNIDDGSGSWEESLQMVEIAVQDGITGAVATPHWIQGTTWQPRPDYVRSLVAEFNDKIAERGIDFRVYAGMEVGIIPDLPRLVASGEILALADGDFVLIEIPFYSLPIGLDEVISGIGSIGKTAVLAHPERSRDFQRKPDSMIRLAGMGALVQVTAGSLAGSFGDSARKCALEFANLDVLHFVSSDSHSTKHRRPVVSKGLSVLEKHIGKEKVEEIVLNSYKVIESVNARG